VEAWTEVNLHPATPHDASLLTGLVDELVHDVFAAEIETWFYFWEPELRLRLRWRDPARANELRARLASPLDEARERGLIVDWYEGAHGRRGERYTGEAEAYGDEAWPQVQRDWMNGSELALLLLRHERAGTLTKPRAYHWSRHVHLFTNQLYGTWDDEIELCLAQARGYLRHVVDGGGPATDEAKRLIDELVALAGETR